MAALGNVLGHGRRAEPPFPVQRGRRIDLLERAAGVRRADLAGHPFHLANAAGLHQRDRCKELLLELASLLRAHLEHAAGLLDCLADELAFVDGERERLLAVNILARLERLDRDLHMPVIGHANVYDLDIFAIKHMAVIFVGVAGAVEVAVGCFEMLLVDIAQRDHVQERPHRIGMMQLVTPDASHADRAALGLFVIGQIGRSLDHRPRQRPAHQAGAQPGSRRQPQTGRAAPRVNSRRFNPLWEVMGRLSPAGEMLARGNSANELNQPLYMNHTTRGGGARNREGGVLSRTRNACRPLADVVNSVK